MQGTVTEAEVKMRAKKKKKNKTNLNIISALKMHTVKEKRHVNKSTLIKCLRWFLKKSVQSGWGMDAGVADPTAS